jgi:quercetin dioxygenase-like cupin family protein
MAKAKRRSREVQKKLIIPGRITPNNSKFIRGRVVLKGPGDETGAHVAKGKEEIIIVLEGVATVQLEKGKNLVRAGSSFFVADGVLHNVRNEGDGPLRYVYVRSLAKNEKKGEHAHAHRTPHKAHKHPAKKKKGRSGLKHSH